MISNGVDIIKVERIEKVLQNKKLFNNIFTENEKEYFKSRNNNIETIAGVFAAKEAILKCMHKGLEGYKLTEIEVNHEGYAPYLTFYGDIKKEIELHNLKFAVSISHDGEYAIAFVSSL